MIDFNYIEGAAIFKPLTYSKWLTKVIESESKVEGDITYIFCDDAYLLELNKKYLQHDTYTDIITFDYTEGDIISGDIFISLERVEDNAQKFEVIFENELQRVMAHGVLHLMGYKDKSSEEAALMRSKEDEKIQMFHVEQ